MDALCYATGNAQVRAEDSGDLRQFFRQPAAASVENAFAVALSQRAKVG